MEEDRFDADRLDPRGRHQEVFLFRHIPYNGDFIINDVGEEYDDIEKLYIKQFYPKHKIKRAITIFGGYLTDIPDEKVIVYLRQDGKTIINKNDEIIQKIFDYCENLKNKMN